MPYVYFLTVWNRVLFEKLIIVAPLFKKPKVHYHVHNAKSTITEPVLQFSLELFHQAE
jgi:hypothetical protein